MCAVKMFHTVLISASAERIQDDMLGETKENWMLGGSKKTGEPGKTSWENQRKWNVGMVVEDGMLLIEAKEMGC